MPLVCSWSEVGDVQCQVSSSRFLHVERSLRGGNPDKKGKNCKKIHAPVRPPKMGGTTPENVHFLFPLVFGLFSPFSGVDVGRGSLQFFPCFRDFPARRLSGPCKAKTCLEAQQRYFSCRAILVAMVSQNSFVLVCRGYSPDFP